MRKKNPGPRRPRRRGCRRQCVQAAEPRRFEGSQRLSRAFADSDRRKKAGDVAGAREVLEGALAVEVVPLYRKHATTMLDYVDEPEDRGLMAHDLGRAGEPSPGAR
ncbi:MAG: DUF2379 family protein [Cystobacter sp.]